MSMEAAPQQHARSTRSTRSSRGAFRVYKGVEANILADGSLDLQDDERARLRIRARVTALAAAQERRSDGADGRRGRAPGVAILGHPQGRMYNTRPGVTADWRRCSRRRARATWRSRSTATGIARMSTTSSRRIALDAGCMFALDSDAHSIAELPFTDSAIAHARLAGCRPTASLNCWDDGGSTPGWGAASQLNSQSQDTAMKDGFGTS